MKRMVFNWALQSAKSKAMGSQSLGYFQGLTVICGIKFTFFPHPHELIISDDLDTKPVASDSCTTSFNFYLNYDFF